MTLFFYQFHKRSSKHAAGRTIFPLPARDAWPEEWKTIYYKKYQGAPVVALPSPIDIPVIFSDLVAKRKSTRGGHHIGISSMDLSVVLKYSCGLQDNVRGENGVRLRSQPSGGARFPLEIYIVSLKKENQIKPGIYHYNVENHVLDVLRIRDFSHKDIASLFTYPWAQDCSLAIVITAVFYRSAMKYGERAYRYSLLEAGHIGQGVYLSGTSRNVGVVAMGGIRDEALHALLDIDGTHESLVYALMLSQ